MLKNNLEFNKDVPENYEFIEKLKKYFPEYFLKNNDSNDNEINIKTEFDLSKFIQSLKQNDLNIKNEGFSLNFTGKTYAKKQFGEKPNTVIVPNKIHNEQDENIGSENIFYSGDNIEVLKHLQNSYQKLVDIIYIDPPYNTGNGDFVYPDSFDFTDEQLKSMFNLDDEQLKRVKSIQNSSSHSAWLTFMYPRLQLAKRLLDDEGVIFISIDNNEFANLKLIMDEIFGESSFVTTIHIELSLTQGMKVAAAQNGNIVKNGEYILVYSKNGRKDIARVPLYDIKNGYDNHFTHVITKVGNEYTKVSLVNYIKNNDYWKGYFDSYKMEVKIENLEKLITIDKKFQKDFYENLAPNIFQEMAASINVPENINKKLDYKEIVEFKKYLLGKTKNGKIRQYSSLKEQLKMSDNYNQKFGRVGIRGDYWKGFYSDMMNIQKEGGIEYNNGKKPTRLMEQLIKLTGKKDAIVLDFFAGSASTAHAVMNLNNVDNGTRKYIMVQIPWPLFKRDKEGKIVAKTGNQKYLNENLRYIDEISIMRIKNCQKGLKDTLDKSVKGFKHFNVVKPQKEVLDKIENIENIELNLFDNMIDIFSSDYLNIKGDATGKDTIITTWLMEDNFGFNTKTEKISILNYELDYVDNSRIYLISEGWTSTHTLKLVNLIGENELKVQAVVIYGYSFGLEEIRELEIALNQLDNKVNLIKRY